jgi:hypothetical protein
MQHSHEGSKQQRKNLSLTSSTNSKPVRDRSVLLQDRPIGAVRGLASRCVSQTAWDATVVQLDRPLGDVHWPASLSSPVSHIKVSALQGDLKGSKGHEDVMQGAADAACCTQLLLASPT